MRSDADSEPIPRGFRTDSLRPYRCTPRYVTSRHFSLIHPNSKQPRQALVASGCRVPGDEWNLDMLSREQADALALLVHLLRPEWDKAGIFASLGRCKDRNELDVSMAAIRAAGSTEIRTPGAIPSNGAHWHERVSAPITPRPPKPSEACRTCGRHMHGPDATCQTPTMRPLASAPPPVAYLDARRMPPTDARARKEAMSSTEPKTEGVC